MLRARGGGNLESDGYGSAFSAITSEDMAVLTETVVGYAEQLARTLAEVGELRAQLEAMAMQQQPRVENFANNAVSQATTYQYGDPQDYGFYMLHEQTTSRGPHPGPFGSPQDWQQWSQSRPSGQP